MKDAPLRHRFEQAAWAAVRGPVSLLGPAGARAVGCRLGDLMYAALPARRRRSRANLELAFPELDAAGRRRLARETFRSLGASSCDLIASRRLDGRSFCARLRLENWPRLAEVEAAGKGLLVMSAHLGFWEGVGLAIGLYRGPLHVVGRPLDNPHLERELAAWRTRFGNRLIPKRGAARGLVRVLRERGRVALIIDQRVQPHEGVEVPFFGRPAVTSPLLARMASRFQTPVVPVFCLPEPGGRYRVVVREPLPPPPPEEPPAVFTARCMEVVEAEIRRAPGQWMWMHDRWRGAGAG